MYNTTVKNEKGYPLCMISGTPGMDAKNAQRAAKIAICIF